MKKIYQTDPYLEPFKNKIESRHKAIEELAKRFAAGGSIASVMNNHLYYGMHRMGDGSWVFREWAPNANRIYLIGEFNNWKRVEIGRFVFQRCSFTTVNCINYL